MEKIPLREIIAVVGGKLLSGRGTEEFSGVSIDTRTIQEGDLFIALKGERFDGNDFVLEAIKKGASAAIVSRQDLRAEKSLIFVENTLNALQELARWYRTKFSIPVIGITGSVGKTTMARMISSIGRQKFPTHETIKNFNGQIGLPLTILALRPKHRLAVVEIGISLPGEMEILLPIVHPNLGVLTNTREVHIEFLGSIEGVRKEKAKLFQYLGKGAKTVIPFSEQDMISRAKNFACNVLTFGWEKEADVHLIQEPYTDENGTHFYCNLAPKTEFFIPTFGSFNVLNALGAIATTSLLDFEPELMQSGLKAYKQEEKRLNIINIPPDTTIIDDTYNASFSSMKGALEVLKERSMGRRTVAVLGDMLELGEKSEAIHRELGRFIDEIGIDVLICIGALSHLISDEAKSVKVNLKAKDLDEGKAILSKVLQRGDIVLFKASRAMKFEILVSEALSRFQYLNL